MLIGIFGISGVGKSTILKKIKLSFENVKCFSASELLYENGSYISYPDLTTKTACNNQKKLVNKVHDLVIVFPFKKIYLELHVLLETKENIFFVQSNDLKHLNLDIAIFFYDDPLNIFIKRQNDKKKRSYLTISDLEKLQTQAINHFERVFKNHQKHLIKIDNWDYISQIIRDFY